MKSEIMGIQAPAKDCTDKKCPFHGEITVKKELFTGKVVKKDVSRSATIEWFKPFFVPKYERYEIRRYRLRTHNPGCVNAQIGDEVLVAKTRPLSKTKHHVIVNINRSGMASAVSSSTESPASAVLSSKKNNKVGKNKPETESKQKKRSSDQQ